MTPFYYLFALFFYEFMHAVYIRSMSSAAQVVGLAFYVYSLACNKMASNGEPTL